MKAVVLHAFGKSDVLQYEEAPMPQPAAGEVCIRVRAAGVNPFDWKIRQGAVEKQVPHQLPLILGWDAAGDIAAVGGGVTAFAVGDPVYVMANPARNGAYAEFLVVDAALVAPKPASLDYVAAASVPLAGETAMQATYDAGQVAAGQTVLIHGGAGSVGGFAVQLAKARGARVIATASAADLAYVRELGADQVIDFQHEQFEAIVRDVDMVLDTQGGDTQAKSWQVLRPAGVLVSTVQPPTPPAGAPSGVRGVMLESKPSGDTLRALSALVETGQLKTLVQQVLPLSQARQAHDLLEGGHGGRGKVVLEIA